MYADDRRVPPGGGIILALLSAVILWAMIFGLVRAAHAQETRDTSRAWIIFADTAGISPIPGLKDTYVTWVFARATPTAFPSSGVLVAWDCAAVKVKRLAQVKYQLNPDSTIAAPVEEVNRPWQDVSDERLYNLVCSIGPIHAHLWSDDDAPPSPHDPRWSVPGKPRTDA